MEAGNDISVLLPAEYFDSLSEVIKTGLKKAKLSPEVRKALSEWWDAEHELASDELRK